MVLGLGNSIVSGAALESAYVATASWDFDGTNDHINLGNSSTIKLVPTDTSEGTGLTASCWMHADDWSGVSGVETFFSCEQYGIDADDGKGWGMYRSDNTIVMVLDTTVAKYTLNAGWRPMASSSNTQGTSPFWRSSGWHLFTMTFDGRYFRTYIDATAMATASNTGADDTAIDYGSNQTNVDILLGADPSSLTSPDSGSTWTPGTSLIGAPFEGMINEAAIWNKALDTDAIEEIFEAVNTDGAVLDLTKDSGDYDYSGNLVGLWRASDASGTTAVDATGNNDGSIKNSTGTSTDVPS